jgi:hypothetical protein
VRDGTEKEADLSLASFEVGGDELLEVVLLQRRGYAFLKSRIV